jgi:cell division protein FtsW (lipid II flippase)
MKVAATGVLPALLLGVILMLAHAEPHALPLLNLASAAGGFLVLALGGQTLAALLVNRPGAVAAVILSVELLTLVSPGIAGVHRWISLGDVRLHPAAILNPLLLLAVILLWHGERGRAATSVVVAGLMLHVLQPDAGQASALAAGALALALCTGPKGAPRLGMIVVAVAGAVLAWLRPDPLWPVDAVENIIPMAFSLHALLGVLSIVALALIPAAALWRLRDRKGQSPRGAAASVSLAAYLLASILVLAFGEFPTPVLGFGASPILGVVLGLGLVAGEGR